MVLNNEKVAAFGKIVFFPTKESVPPLPEMSLLFLNQKDDNIPWRAACIDLEIDACGSTQSEAWENLKKSLTMLIDMEIKAAEGSIKNAAKNIIKSAFSESNLKREYFKLYREAKMEFTMGYLDSNSLYDPIEKEKERLAALESSTEPIRSFFNELKAA